MTEIIFENIFPGNIQNINKNKRERGRKKSVSICAMHFCWSCSSVLTVCVGSSRCSMTRRCWWNARGWKQTSSARPSGLSSPVSTTMRSRCLLSSCSVPCLKGWYSPLGLVHAGMLRKLMNASVETELIVLYSVTNDYVSTGKTLLKKIWDKSFVESSEQYSQTIFCIDCEIIIFNKSIWYFWLYISGISAGTFSPSQDSSG